MLLFYVQKIPETYEDFNDFFGSFLRNDAERQHVYLSDVKKWKDTSGRRERGIFFAPENRPAYTIDGQK